MGIPFTSLMLDTGEEIDDDFPIGVIDRLPETDHTKENKEKSRTKNRREEVFHD